MKSETQTAERAVLGCLLLYPATWPSICAVISDADFSDLRHRLIWQTCAGLVAKGTPIELTTLRSELDLRGALDKVGGLLYLGGLGDDVAVSAHAEHYARQVKEASIQRRLIDAGRRIAGYQNGAVADNLTAAFDVVSELVTEYHGQRSQIRPIKETIDAATDEAVSLDAPRGLIRTGIGALDNLTGGLWPGLLTVCASRPSIGKSMLAVPNIAVNVALSGRKVLLITLEDTARFVQWRILARLASVPLDRITRRILSAEQRAALNAKRELIGALPLWVDDSSAATPEQISQSVVNHLNKHGVDLVIIDHLAHVAERGKDLYEKTTQAVAKINQLAKDIDRPVLLLHQLSRASLQNKDKIPTLADLRQSGEIEQRARQVWLLHRPHYYDNTEDPFEFWIVAAKNSHGQTGTLKVTCSLDTMYIHDDKIRYGEERREARNGF